MGITKMTLRFLRLDLGSCIGYTLSIAAEFFIIFNIFNLYFVPGIIPDITEDKILMGMIFIVITFVILLLGYGANDYFVKRRGKEVAIEMVSGLSIFGVSYSFTLQNFIFNLVSLLIGGGLALVSTPYFLKILYDLTGTEGDTFVITPEGVGCTLVIILVQIIFISLNNAGLSHRTEICDLIKMSDNKYKPKKFSQGVIFITAFLGLAVFIYWLPIYYSIYGVLTTASPYGGMDIVTVAGGFGTCLLILFVIPRLIDLILKKFRFNNRHSLIYLRNLKRTLENSTAIMFSFTIVTTLISVSLEKFDKSIAFAFITTVGLSMISILIFITWIYKIAVESKKRVRNFRQLHLLGYTKKEIFKMINIETILYIFITLMLPFIQLVATVFLYRRAGLFHNEAFIVLGGYFAIILGISLAGLVIYRRTINKGLKGGK